MSSYYRDGAQNPAHKKIDSLPKNPPLDDGFPKTTDDQDAQDSIHQNLRSQFWSAKLKVPSGTGHTVFVQAVVLMLL